jgi:hypothetical protein
VFQARSTIENGVPDSALHHINKKKKEKMEEGKILHPKYKERFKEIERKNKILLARMTSLLAKESALGKESR